MEKALKYSIDLYGEDIVKGLELVLKVGEKSIFRILTKEAGDIGLIPFVINENGNCRFSDREEMDYISYLIG